MTTQNIPLTPDSVMSPETVTTHPPTQSDDAWKRVLDRWLESFFQCFWPDIADTIDWQVSIEELSQEMQSFTTNAAVGKQIVDKLYKVQTKDCQEHIVLIRIEVQGHQENAFSQRLFEYCYKIYDRHQLPLST